jgi:hypothetical protein
MSVSSIQRMNLLTIIFAKICFVLAVGYPVITTEKGR